MEKQQGEEQILIQQQGALKCPRCDSSNTKFCYYNNYSLSQPRHFCKACKRYWTRGGTLRNVPVGGGYRRNKRTTTTNTTLIKKPTTLIDATSISPMFYGLSSSNNNNPRPCDVNLIPLSRFNLSRVSNSGYDGFSTGFMSSETNGYNTSGFNSVMPSVLSSTTLQLQHKFMNDGLKYGSNNFQVGLDEEKKVEGQNSKFEWNNGVCQNQIEHVGLYDDSISNSSLYWNIGSSSGIGVWNDQGANIASSLTSLI